MFSRLVSKISVELSIDSFVILAWRFTSVIRLSREPGCETRDRHKKAAQIRNELVSAANLSIKRSTGKQRLGRREEVLMSGRGRWIVL